MNSTSCIQLKYLIMITKKRTLSLVILTCTLFLCLSMNLNAQYKINLSDRDYPTLEKLKLGHPGSKDKAIEINNLYMTIGGKPVLPVMGEFHFSRFDHNFWEDTLLKMKSSGVNIIATYCIWSLHEEREGYMNWTGNNNLRAFLELCKKHDLLVHLRFGPYCNAEIRNGGLPDWLIKKGVKTRSNDPLYLAYSQKWYDSVFQQVEGLLYKDEGPVMALQLENEYVVPGMTVPHLMTLKKMAIKSGFDVPIYSMTHWMDSDFPQGEIVPYGGYYIETPWINSGKNEVPISNFQFFSYNRISDNIGTDIIKVKGNTESLIGEENSSPYFTCEVGVGTPSFYYRRPIVPKEMGGANVNLRLGCGVNLMGYYMYTGGTNPVGEETTLESSSSGPVSYDYQAPIREFGELGNAMTETKKFNFFMNDFGSRLAPAIAYLPSSNNNTKNLQWAVRLNKDDGFLFVSNYLYRHDRKDYNKVQFTLNLNDETLKLPSKSIKIKNGAYFLWPINQVLEDVKIKYATVQPICHHKSKDVDSYFFFASNDIPVEYMLEESNIQSIKHAYTAKTSKGNVLISEIEPGLNSVIEIINKQGKKIRLITLTQEQSDDVWKGSLNNKDVVLLTKSGVLFKDEIELFSENAKQTMLVYESDLETTGSTKGLFTEYHFSQESNNLKPMVTRLLPMQDAHWISSDNSNWVEKTFNGKSLSKGKSAIIRMKSKGEVKGQFNSENISFTNKGTYLEADLTSYLKQGPNKLSFSSNSSFEVVSSIEVKLENGDRLTWNTDGTWQNQENTPIKEGIVNTIDWSGEEHVSYYKIETPPLHSYFPEVRLKVSFSGDKLLAYIGEKLVNDKLFDGDEWIFGLNRYFTSQMYQPIIIELQGFETEDPQVYFEKDADLTNLTHPIIKESYINTEYRFSIR